ncbi:MAG: serine protease [Actinomycetota bacterium]
MSRIGGPVLLVLVVVIGLQHWSNPEGAAEVWGEVPVVGGALDALGLGVEPDWDAIAVDVAPHVRYVEGEGCDGPQTGLGFVVAGHLLTAGHLVDGGAPVRITQPTAAAPSAQSVAVEVDAAHDLAWAMVSVNGDGLELDAAVPEAGAVVLLASVGRSGPAFSTGRVHLHLPDGGYGYRGPLLLIEADTEAGFSGGPAVSAAGDVVAMVVARDRTTGLALAVPGSALADLNGATAASASTCEA